MTAEQLKTQIDFAALDIQKRPVQVCDHDVDLDHMGKYCDHTVLRAYTKKSVVGEFCDEAIKYGAAAVCINPIHVPYVKERLKGTNVEVSCVIGFPLGATTPAVKAFEAAEAVDNGADELDVVINVGALRDENYMLVYDDIKGVVDAARYKAKVKVIIETCYLNEYEKIAACVISREAGADFVKTSSGFGTSGATVEDVALMCRISDGVMQVKASTDVNTRADAIKMVKAGATRLGISRVVQIVTGDDNADCASKRNQPPKY